MTDTTDPTPPTKFDPTESTRTLTADLFSEQAMTLREHQDTDRHFIGDSLPIPSDVQMSAVGNGTAWAGKLPFPARVDHRHNHRTVWSIMTAPYQAMSPGRTFFTQLAHGSGKPMLTTSQVVSFPEPGLYGWWVKFQCDRIGGGGFTGDVALWIYTGNGSTVAVGFKRSVYDMSNSFVEQSVSFVLTGGAPSIYDNLQLAVEFNDVANWNIKVDHLWVIRLGDAISA